jgi:ankyrin repeat protein
MPAFFFFPSPPSYLRLDAVTNADEYDRTALHRAANEGHLPTVELLLRSGAEINTTSKTPSPYRIQTSNEALDCGLKCVGFKEQVV